MNKSLVLLYTLFYILLLSNALLAQELSLTLVGNAGDPSSIRITRAFSSTQNNITFDLCAGSGVCTRLGNPQPYSDCQIRALIAIPVWAILFDGGENFSKARGTWATFARLLLFSDNYEFVRRQIEGHNVIEVPRLISNYRPPRVSLTNEAEKISRALFKVDGKACSKN